MLMRPNRIRRKRAHESDDVQDNALVELLGLDDLVGYRLRMAYVASSRRFAAAMQRLDLTQKQASVLWLIDANKGVSQIALATQLGMDRASMMAIVDRLQDRGLVIRKQSSSDGRRQELYVTARGRKVLSRAKTAIAEHEKWLTSCFSSRELASFVSALARIGK